MIRLDYDATFNSPVIPKWSQDIDVSWHCIALGQKTVNLLSRHLNADDPKLVKNEIVFKGLIKICETGTI